jgi:DNA polymerase-3 subunit epsilon
VRAVKTETPENGRVSPEASRPAHAPPAVASADLRRVVVFDTEAGGLDPLRHSLMSVGFVDFSGAHRLEVYVLEPDVQFEPEAMAVNGIDLHWLRANGLSPAEACDRIEAFLDGLGMGRPLMMAGHNIAFDLAYMRRLYTLAGRPLPRDFSHRSLDTHTLLYAWACAGRLPPEARSSDGAFKHFGVAPPPHLRHTALGDAVATRDLLAHLLDLCGAP